MALDRVPITISLLKLWALFKRENCLVGMESAKHVAPTACVSSPFVEVKERIHPPGERSVIPYGWHFISLSLGSRFDLGKRSGKKSTKQSVNRGEVILDPGYTPNTWTWHQSVHFVHVNLPFTLLERFAMETGKERSAVELREHLALSDPQTARYIESIHREAMEGQWASSIALEGLSSCLAVHLLRHFNVRPLLRDDTATHSRGLGKNALRRVLEYVQEHLKEPIPVAEMASVAGMSTYHFIRLFKFTVGVSPHQYVLEQRVTRARYWLQHHPQMTVSEIALRTGFTDQTHLARQMRRLTGLSPSDLRRLLK